MLVYSPRLLSLATLAVLNRPAEFKSHVRGALRNGCTKEAITEVLLQAAVYGGVPVGMSSFALAREVFKEMETAKQLAGGTNERSPGRPGDRWGVRLQRVA